MFIRAAVRLCPFVLLCAAGCPQTPEPEQSATEVASQDAPLTFKSKVNLVLVPVVVRDRAGKAVGALRQEDFQLFDKGKAQIITRFSVEKPGSRPIALTPAPERTPDEKALQSETRDVIAPDVIPPDHFVAYLFDDIHLNFGDLIGVRDAATRHFQSELKPTDRAAIYTTSGQTTLDFTDDRDKLLTTLQQISPHPIARSTTQECPDVSYYMADLIQNHSDTAALNAATQDALICMNLDSTMVSVARQAAEAAAMRVINTGGHETRVSLLVLKQLVQRMSAMPGQRVIVLVSPGFLRLSEHMQEETEIIDHAIRSNVTIGALDARGLYTGAPDIARRTTSVSAELMKQQYDRASASAEADVMAEIAAGTGGAFFQNSNDLAQGVRDLSSTPEVYYILGFSPQNLKLDGSYHSLRVSLKAAGGLNAKARRGYYAPRHLTDADEEAKEEISQALFSRDEMRDIPVDLRTQFFKSSATEAKLILLSRLDVRKLRYRKAEGRNTDEVMIVSGLFDRNGNYLEGVSKLLKMNLRDETLAGKLGNGVTIRSEFKVAPGTYVIRLVVRDAEGQLMTAQNGAVEIP